MATYYGPWDDLEALRREMNRTFEDFSGGYRPRRGRVAFLPGRAARQYPLVNLYEDKDNYYAEALAPGVDPASLDLSIDGQVLVLSGEKKGPDNVPDEAYHRSERSAGKFTRRVELSGTVNMDAIKAEYKNGLVVITMPKAAEAKPRQIQVTAH
ncbi:MAG: Hsp20/alpha crystallin family protein [Dehalococcoidales bacterium]|nr:Hsp20/alpha crystallin family protein [Dehalococcoidales bacterium]